MTASRLSFPLSNRHDVSQHANVANSSAVFAPNNIEARSAPDLPPTARPKEGFLFYHEKETSLAWSGYAGKLSEVARERGEAANARCGPRVLVLESLKHLAINNPKEKLQ